MFAKLTYDEAIELAARLYRGRRMAEMALCGDLGMTRVTSADLPLMVAMIADLRADGEALTKLTRMGREVWRRLRRPCEGCNAEPFEACRPGCLGEAANQDAQASEPDGCTCCQTRSLAGQAYHECARCGHLGAHHVTCNMPHDEWIAKKLAGLV